MRDEYGPWALIIGGSEGVGEELADQVAAAGMDVFLVARKPGPLEETAARVRRHGVDVRTLAQDLTAADATDRIVEATADLEVGLLAVNAGANTLHDSFLDSDVADVRRLVDLGVTAPLELAHAYGRQMRDRGRGAILLMGSLAGYVGSTGEGTYAATKAFGRVFAEGLWSELREHGVHVLHLVLGVTRTPAMQRAGLDFDLPGMHVSEPADVAREALAHLADGPVRVVSGNEKLAEMRSTLDRAPLVARTDAILRRLMNRQ